MPQPRTLYRTHREERKLSCHGVFIAMRVNCVLKVSIIKQCLSGAGLVELAQLILAECYEHVDGELEALFKG